MHLDSIYYYNEWSKLRESTPLKLKNTNKLKFFEEVLFSISQECIHTDLYRDGRRLVYSEGSANFDLFKLTPQGDYISQNPMLNLWKRCDVDSKILSVFEHLSNTKYEQPSVQTSIGRPYNLFLLQMASTVDLTPTLDALKYATEMKRYTVFKIHPAVGDGTDFYDLWDKFSHHGIISEYTPLVEGDLNTLIEHADIVYSADSACTFNAMLKRKTVYNYRSNEFSEIVPIIQSSKQLDEYIIPEEDLLRFLTWYYYVLTIDIRSTFDGKIEKIISSFESGKNASEIFACK